ncbi:MAG: transaldolase [Sulfurospirillaceae bacterium]|nr:transaldolase [Sulfurospirillaceae bacterium]MDD3462160.1 transaldolase [Sulfurospirillaceae bacterium]
MYKKDSNFALWCDFVERSFLDGEFVELLNNNIVNGATSNPSIFKSAFLTSKAYAKDKEELFGKSPKEIYESLAIGDIKSAASKLLPLYESGDDGFISIEVDPFLCDDVEGTIAEGKKLFELINFPNVMIKIPATTAGFKAMEALISQGINVNATLVFSMFQAEKCLEAFKKGNDEFCKNNTSKALPKGVISVFVSRFDRELDDFFRAINFPQSRLGIMNALRIYHLIEEYGLSNIRCLFASTGVKGDALSADYYIKELLCKNSINTAPLSTIKYFIAQPKEAVEVVVDKEEVELFFDKLRSDANIDIEKVCSKLMQEGLGAFREAFEEILKELK